MEVLILRFPLHLFDFFRLRSKYSTQHPVFKNFSVFFPLYKTPISHSLDTAGETDFIRFIIYFFRQKMEIRQIEDGFLASIWTASNSVIYATFLLQVCPND
jgi:hypothetical protein